MHSFLFVCHSYLNVFTLHCTAHALDLALEQIGEHDFSKSAINRAKKVVQLITKSPAPHAVFKGKSELRLLKPGNRRIGNCCLLRLYLLPSFANSQYEMCHDMFSGDTRFLTAYISCARLLDMQERCAADCIVG